MRKKWNEYVYDCTTKVLVNWGNEHHFDGTTPKSRNRKIHYHIFFLKYLVVGNFHWSHNNIQHFRLFLAHKQFDAQCGWWATFHLYEFIMFIFFATFYYKNCNDVVYSLPFVYPLDLLAFFSIISILFLASRMKKKSAMNSKMFKGKTILITAQRLYRFS